LRKSTTEGGRAGTVRSAAFGLLVEDIREAERKRQMGDVLLFYRFDVICLEPLNATLS
jgi:hypothetical protein